MRFCRSENGLTKNGDASRNIVPETPPIFEAHWHQRERRKAHGLAPPPAAVNSNQKPTTSMTNTAYGSADRRKPDRIEEEDPSHKSSRTRDESQRIAGQAYSRAYNTPFKSSRLQGIPAGHTVPFHSSATTRPASGPDRDSHPSHDPDCPKTVYRQIQSRSRLHFVDLSSGASGLEAFSRYPTHDSFSALPGRATEFTSHANQRFLSY